VSVNSVNIVHSVNKVVNPHKDSYHYVGGVPHTWKSIKELVLEIAYIVSYQHLVTTD
jgi:hypothetical protein